MCSVAIDKSLVIMYNNYILTRGIIRLKGAVIFVYLLIFCLPTSPPSFINFSNEGIIIANNWITIDAVIYGLIDIANIENLEKAPPDIKSINPVNPFVVIASFNATASTPGTVI